MVIPTNRLEAVACVKGAGGIHGQVRFYTTDCGVLVVAEIRGLPKNGSDFFALHIHAGNSCGGEGYADTGGHYDPKGNPHPLHAGDLPPLLSQNGRAFLVVETGRFRISDVIGRTVVIHSGPDDFHSQPAGNAGEKIACGVIRRI